jgi:alkanesulfonate monooxygenase SsuD/methylene tetrahydromethanopterin reductase-like flavin-dependent oxidoreductase (luciferase family)
MLEDQLAILHGVWAAAADETFDFKGRTCAVHIDADTVRPHQRPHPPIILGGHGGPRSVRLVATYADEYNVAFVPAADMRDCHDKARRACEKVGRDPDTVTWSTAQVLCCGRTEAELARRAEAIGRRVDELRENGLAGAPQEVLDKMGRFTEYGAARFYLQVLDLNDLDHLRLVGEDVLPHAPGR